MQNPDDGKFCRKCGTDLKTVSAALSGKPRVSGKEDRDHLKKQRRSWESAFSTLFVGIAFLAVSIVLAFQPMGRSWWFWMLIPAFAMIGTGVARIIRFKQEANERVVFDADPVSGKLKQGEREALPPSETDYVSASDRGAGYQTGDLVPPSVAEGTTRHLEMDSEGETMTLPSDKVK